MQSLHTRNPVAITLAILTASLTISPVLAWADAHTVSPATPRLAAPRDVMQRPSQVNPPAANIERPTAPPQSLPQVQPPAPQTERPDRNRDRPFGPGSAPRPPSQTQQPTGRFEVVCVTPRNFCRGVAERAVASGLRCRCGDTEGRTQ